MSHSKVSPFDIDLVCHSTDKALQVKEILLLHSSRITKEIN